MYGVSKNNVMVILSRIRAQLKDYCGRSIIMLNSEKIFESISELDDRYVIDSEKK